MNTLRLFVLKEYILERNVNDDILDNYFFKLAYDTNNNIIKNKSFNCDDCFFSDRVRCLLDLKIRRKAILSNKEIEIIKKEFKWMN